MNLFKANHIPSYELTWNVTRGVPEDHFPFKGTPLARFEWIQPSQLESTAPDHALGVGYDHVALHSAGVPPGGRYSTLGMPLAGTQFGDDLPGLGRNRLGMPLKETTRDCL